jgi:hypothetical protein
VPEPDADQGFSSARANLKETAKWIVTIVGATIVLVVGGGLIAKIADLDWTPRLIAAGSLLVLTLVCLIPLRAAIDIIAARLASFQAVAKSEEYAETRAIVNGWMAGHYNASINSVEKLYDEYLKQITIANDKEKSADERQKANAAIAALQPRIREIIELANTELLRLKFEALVRATTLVLPLIGAALFVFLVYTHHDEQTEKQLNQPMLLQIAWNADVEAALKKAGLAEACYAPNRPQFLQVSEKSGLRAGALVIPKDPGPPCPVVRVVITGTGQVYPDN